MAGGTADQALWWIGYENASAAPSFMDPPGLKQD